MNKKKYFIIILVVLAILAGGVLLRHYFSSGSAKKIEIQSEAIENDNPAEIINVENSEVVLEEVKNSNPEKTATEKTASTDKISITNKFVSWGYEKASGREIDTIVIHSTYNALGGDPFSLEKILNIYKSYGVSPHYIIDRGGKIYRLVADENTAYHAGESKAPDGRTGVNNFSIGIEIINSKTEKPTEAQYSALKKIIAQLKSEYSIKYVLGHNQIAPGRKDDPWNFEWNKIKK